MKGRAIKYSQEELGFVKLHSKEVRSEMVQWFNKRFGRDVSLPNINALCKRNGWLTGRTGCFQKGNISHNKGKAFPVAANHPNCRKTHFKKGDAPHNTNYLGHERISKGGYVEISVDQVNPYTGYLRTYVLKHRHEWVKVNGPIPEGYALKCLDGDKTNCHPSNWDVVHRGVLARLNGGRFRKTIPYDEAPPELKPTVMASAKIKHLIKEGLE